MDRREFLTGGVSALAGCGGSMEYEIQPSPGGSGSQIHADVPGFQAGLWTPTLGGTATYVLNRGTYIKIGRMVFIDLHIRVNSIGTGSTILISGLPFPGATGDPTSPDDRWAISVASFTDIATNVVFLTGYIESTASTITLHSLTAAGISTAGNPIFGSSTILRMSGWYKTNS